MSTHLTRCPRDVRLLCRFLTVDIIDKEESLMIAPLLGSNDPKLIEGTDGLTIGMIVHAIAFDPGAPYGNGAINQDFTISDIEQDGHEIILHTDCDEFTLAWEAAAERWNYYSSYPDPDSLSPLEVQVTLPDQVEAA